MVKVVFSPTTLLPLVQLQSMAAFVKSTDTGLLNMMLFVFGS